jgi:uncharacterized RDD family membrane protein YckC
MKKLPTVSERIKAASLDTFVIILLMVVVSQIFSAFNEVKNEFRAAAFVLVILYEPITTSLWGGTIGHYIFGIRVRRNKNRFKNILFPVALIRFALKISLGWLSLLTVNSHKEKKAIHDSITGSIVVFKDYDPNNLESNTKKK